MHPMLTTAVKAARKAGAIITRASYDLERLTIRRKQHNDFVTEVDHAAEDAIIRTLREAYPSHAFLAEESGASSAAANSDHLWIIDPLDGTTNFLHGFPQYCVSIALKHKGVLQQAVVYDPNRNELFTATRGAGAFLNDRRLRVSATDRLEDALIGTGFPFREFDQFDEYLRMFGEITRRVAGVRRPGAAALDLAWVAAGRLDGFWEMGLSPWDMAGGALLVREAGGLVGDLEGAEGFLDSGRIVAANSKVFAPLLQALAKRA
ncbi:MAG TPA: inositol monophosphatase family protein [Usitatibacteraceae bacterium]|nr:inositol monophosphatase family protein [Usitatibacteraceae bacterium]